MSISVVLASLVLLALLGGALFLVRSQYQKTPSPARKPTSNPVAHGQRRNPYRATSIVPGEKACAAAREMGERSFLVEGDEVPLLPLPGCDMPECSCTYAHHADRRDLDDDRRALGRGDSWTIQQGQDERRSGIDRRSEPET